MEMKIGIKTENTCFIDSKFKGFRYVILKQDEDIYCYVNMNTIPEDLRDKLLPNLFFLVDFNSEIKHINSKLNIDDSDVDGPWVGWKFIGSIDPIDPTSESAQKFLKAEMNQNCHYVIRQIRKILVQLTIKNEFTHKEVLDRFHLISAMNEVMRAMNNEDAYMEWIYTCPDEASESDILDIAQSDEMMKDCEKEFFRIIKQYGDDGLFYYQKFHM